MRDNQSKQEVFKERLHSLASRHATPREGVCCPVLRTGPGNFYSKHVWRTSKGDTESAGIGSVIDVLVHRDGGHVMTFAVIKLHQKESVLVVPWHVIRPPQEDDVLMLDLATERLRAAPQYELDRYRSLFAEPEWEQDLSGFYGSAYRDPVVASVSAPRRSSAGIVVLATVLIAVVAGAGYLISQQGWSTTSTQISDQMQNAAMIVQKSSEDAATTAKVRAALALSKRVSVFDIGVNTDREVVTLSGHVPAEEARQIAAAIAEDTSGVREVRNTLVR